MKSIVKITNRSLNIVLLASLQGCWISESEVTEVDNLIENFKIIYNDSDSNAAHILSLKIDDGLYAYIEKHCEQVYFDSTRIFLKYKKDNFDTSRSYCIIRPLANNKKLCERREINSDVFHREVRNCPDCFEIKYK